MDQLHFKSAVEIARLIRERKVSAARGAGAFPRPRRKVQSEAQRHHLARCRARAERAKAADAALAKGEVWGPLHGVPMTIKESYNVAGSPTTWGDPKLQGQRDRDERARRRAAGEGRRRSVRQDQRAADARRLAELQRDLRHDQQSLGRDRGRRAAPRADRRRRSRPASPALEAGSDIGGSIRNPAHYCGVFGLKPTWGVVARRKGRRCLVRTPMPTSRSSGRWRAAPTISSSRSTPWPAPTRSTASPGSSICPPAARARSATCASP